MREPRDRRLRERIRGELETLRKQAQLRELETLDGLSLCSNDYLGLARDPLLKQAALEAVGCAERVGSTGSRLLSGNAPEWEAVESQFAQFAGTATPVV